MFLLNGYYEKNHLQLVSALRGKDCFALVMPNLYNFSSIEMPLFLAFCLQVTKSLNRNRFDGIVLVRCMS